MMFLQILQMESASEKLPKFMEFPSAPCIVIRKRCHHHTHTPMKKKLFPQQAVRSEFSTDKEEVFVDSESDASLSDRNASLALHPVNLVMFRCGDFVIANVHTAAGKCKKFWKAD